MSILNTHLTAEQLKGFVMGTLDMSQTIIVKVHTLNCESCLDDLVAFHLGKVVQEERERGNDHEQLPDHLTETDVLAYVRGDVNLEEEDWIAYHCTQCKDCEQLFQKTAGNHLGSGVDTRPQVRGAAAGSGSGASGSSSSSEAKSTGGWNYKINIEDLLGSQNFVRPTLDRNSKLYLDEKTVEFQELVPLGYQSTCKVRLKLDEHGLTVIVQPKRRADSAADIDITLIAGQIKQNQPMTRERLFVEFNVPFEAEDKDFVLDFKPRA